MSLYKPTYAGTYLQSNWDAPPAATKKKTTLLSSSISKGIFGTLVIIAFAASIGIPATIAILKNQATIATTTATTTAYYSCSTFTIQYDWNYPGNDINNNFALTFPGCCSWCLSTSGCVMFAFLNTTGQCWIKSVKARPGGSNPGMISVYQ